MKEQSSVNSVADVLLHPVRMRIVLAAFGRRLTTQQIAAAIADVPQATLYRHINKLAAAGILTVVEQRPVRGTLEKVYAVVREAVSLNAYVTEMSPADWSHLFTVFTAFLVAQFGAYINSAAADPTTDGLGFRTIPLYLSDDEFTEFSAEMRALVVPKLENTPAPGRRRRQLSTIMIPDPPAAEDGDNP